MSKGSTQIIFVSSYRTARHLNFFNDYRQACIDYILYGFAYDIGYVTFK